MLGPAKEVLLQTQKESLQNDLFSLEIQQSTLEASVASTAFMAQQERPAVGTAERLAELRLKLAEVILRRTNTAASVANVNREMDRAFKIRDAQSCSMEIPPDEEALQYQAYLAAHNGADDGNFEFVEPNLDSVHKYIRNYESRSGIVNPRSFLTKLFSYAKMKKLSHKNIIDVMGCLLSGESYDSFLSIKELGLQRITDHMMGSTTNLSDPILAKSMMKHFVRNSQEGIRACMYRFEILISKAAVIFTPGTNFDSDKIAVLERSVGPKTLENLQSLQSTQISLLHASPSYEDMLRIAERQEVAHGEFTDSTFHAHRLIAPAIHALDLDGDQEMKPQGPSRDRNKTKGIVTRTHMSPESRHGSRARERRRGEKYYRSNSGSRESSADRNRSLTEGPSAQERAYADSLANAKLTNFAANQQTTSPPPPSSPIFGNTSFGSRKRTNDVGPYSSIQRPDSNSDTKPRGRSAHPNDFPTYRQPMMMPQSQDYNRPPATYPNNIQMGSKPNDHRRSSDNNVFNFEGRQRSLSNDRFPGGNERSFGRYRDQSPQYGRGNYNGSYGHNRSGTPTPFNRGRQEYQNRDSGYSNGYRGRSQSPYGTRFQSPSGNLRYQSPSGYYRNQSPGGRPYGLAGNQSALNFAMGNLPGASYSGYKVLGVHLPPNYSYKNPGHGCTKCGGPMDQNGRGNYDSSHNDSQCTKYHLYNDRPCSVCNSLRIRAHHFEANCLRNIGYPVPPTGRQQLALN